jgi:hypothetical protein
MTTTTGAFARKLVVWDADIVVTGNASALSVCPICGKNGSLMSSLYDYFFVL